MVEAKDVTVNVLTSAVTTLVIIFLLIPLLKIPVPAVKETETIKEQKYYYPYTLPIEGDYSTWTIYDSFVDADVGNAQFRQYAIVNKDEDKILIVDGYNGRVKMYTIATKTLTALTEEVSPPFSPDMEGTTKSIQGTYVGMIRYYAPSNYGIMICKNGAKTKELTAAQLGLLANAVYGVSVSPSGKYVIVSGYLETLGNLGWVVLVGS